MGVTRAYFQYCLKLYYLHGDEGFETSYTNDVLNHTVQSSASLMNTAALFKISSYTIVYRFGR